MKISAFILAITILFLAIKPGLDCFASHAETEQNCCGGECTSETNDDSGDKTGNECDKKVCNPFQSCCSYVLFTNPVLIEAVLYPADPQLKKFSHNQKPLSQFHPDFWQPPKLV